MPEDQDKDQLNPEGHQEDPAGPVLFEDDDADHDQGDDAGAQQASGDADQPDPENQTNSTIRSMRKQIKDANREKRRLQRQLEELAEKPKSDVPQLGSKPTLQDFDYDEDRYHAAYDSWIEKRDTINRIEQEKLTAQQREQDELQKFRLTYQNRVASMNVDDFEEAEKEIREIFDQTQTGLMMRGADDPAALVYALYKSPDRLIELSKIKDPVKFTAAVARQEMALKSSGAKRGRVQPEQRITPERGQSGATSSQLDKLREEAAKTGDFTAVTRYKREHNIH